MKLPYGNNLKLYIYGGSHDEKIGMRLENFPAGLRIDVSALRAFLARRAPGGALSSGRHEPDEPIFISGLENGVTDGTPIEAIIENRDSRPSDYNFNDTPRPSHADYAAVMKYGADVDLRGGGHFSGRLTAPLCIAGGICLQYLSERGVAVLSHIYNIGRENDVPFDAANVGNEVFRIIRGLKVLDVTAGERMCAEIEAARAEGDSVGGVVEVAVVGVPVGLGEHMFAGAEARISSALFAIPAVKGVEFGSGFSGASRRGSENNDAFRTDGTKVFTVTNNCGGILGGMTDGMPLVFRAAFKPTPSIAREQDSVSLSKMENVKLKIGGRHDACIIPRAVAAVEAAAAIAVCDMFFDSAEKHGETLEALRGEIDSADNELVAAFRRRMEICENIVIVKNKNNISVTDKSRETALLDRITAIGGEYGDECRRLYGEILSISREYQEKHKK